MRRFHLWFSLWLLGIPFLAHTKLIAALIAARPNASGAPGAPSAVVRSSRIIKIIQ